MPDRDSAGFSKDCPSCGRKVPRNVSTCRCGVTLVKGAVQPPDRPETASGASMGLVAIAAVIIVGAGYWMFTRAEPTRTAASAPAAAEPTSPADRPVAAAASPEARAWNAA